MPEPARENESGWSPTIKSAIQGIGIFFLAQFVVNQITGGGNKNGNTSSPGANAPIPAFDARPEHAVAVESYSPIPQNVAPIWPMDSAFDLSIYVSPSLVMPSFKSMPAESLVVKEKDFKIGDWKDKREIDTNFPVPVEVQQNGTLWAHFYVALAGHELDPAVKGYNAAEAYHFFRPLTVVLPKKKIVKTKKLLGGSDHTEDVEQDTTSGPSFTSYYHPNFTMSVIPDSGTLNYPSLHPAVRQFMVLESTGARDASGQNGWYYPIFFVNTFWQLRDHMTELNSTVKHLPLHISLNNLNSWKFNLYASLDEGMKQNQKQAAGGGLTAGGDGSEFEEFKRILVDTNIYLLTTTAIVSLLHTVFEMLAFKSDISHWRNKKDNVGISVRTILANVFMQTVILLYLVDNREGTSWMILFGQGMGILLEAWKITKTVDVRVRPAPADSWLPYHVTFEDKHKLSDTEKKTNEYDEIAFRYLYLIAIPLLGAYTVYSLLYDTHKSWYSFVITTLVGSVYAYGFLMMVPSLYINYRLQSVAHMPARAMTYKFLNTFIDDLFAYTIKMPLLHRLATLRDDVIFFVYLYQSWKYKVDYTRMNEFGQGGDEEELEDKLANKPLVSSPDADTQSSSKVSGIDKVSAKKRNFARAQSSSTSSHKTTDQNANLSFVSALYRSSLFIYITVFEDSQSAPNHIHANLRSPKLSLNTLHQNCSPQAESTSQPYHSDQTRGAAAQTTTNLLATQPPPTSVTMSFSTGDIDSRHRAMELAFNAALNAAHAEMLSGVEGGVGALDTLAAIYARHYAAYQEHMAALPRHQAGVESALRRHNHVLRALLAATTAARDQHHFAGGLWRELQAVKAESPPALPFVVHMAAWRWECAARQWLLLREREKGWMARGELCDQTVQRRKRRWETRRRRSEVCRRVCKTVRRRLRKMGTEVEWVEGEESSEGSSSGEIGEEGGEEESGEEGGEEEVVGSGEGVAEAAA